MLRASAALDLEWMPLCTYRDYHSHSHGGWDMKVREVPDGFEVDAFPGARIYWVICTGATFIRDSAWHWHFKHRAESARGLDDSEDLFRPGCFTLRLTQGEQATVVLSTETDTPKDVAIVQAQIHRQQTARLGNLPANVPDWIRQLTLAADQFIVDRYQDGQPAGKTIIAGYPWFSDWGRDTMIALPGLTLATQRFEVAASILRIFAAHISEGMLPNRFTDSTETPEYNTVDATLWYFQAIDQYTRRSGDLELTAELYPVLCDIIDWHRRGTRYGIKVDALDGLLAAGEEGVQLTWMDARVDDWVVTPRIGKTVEVNALWYNALHIMASLATHLSKDAQVTEYQNAAAQVKTSFQRFWNETRGCLYDVIDGPEGEQLTRRRTTAHAGTKQQERRLGPLGPLLERTPAGHRTRGLQYARRGPLGRGRHRRRRLEWFLNYRPDLVTLVSHWNEPGRGNRRLLSLLRGHRMKRLLKRVLDETEFLSNYGVRSLSLSLSLSRAHLDEPYVFSCMNHSLSVQYQPAESESGLFGGNSNWCGPIWFPVNYLLVTSMRRFAEYYGEEFKIEYPTGSGRFFSIDEVADAVAERLTRLFRRDTQGRRPVFGTQEKFQTDPHFRDYILFYEYFHGDTGRGVGASHQTGWTGLIAKLLQPHKHG